MRKVLYVFIIAASFVIVSPRSSAQTCQVEGPSLEETTAYIKSALTPAMPDFGFGFNVTTGKFGFYVRFDNQYGSTYYTEQSAPLSSVRCDSLSSGMGADGHTYIQVPCIESLPCVWAEPKCDRGCSGSYVKRFLIPYDSDAEHRDRLTRAVSHYLYLAQQKYKTAHDDPNDPFTKPQ